MIKINLTKDFVLNLSSYKKIIFWCAIIILVLVGIIVLFKFKGQSYIFKNDGTNSSVILGASVSTTQRFLDGVLVNSQDEANALPIAVMIENQIDARPQSGLNEAPLVFETQVEGGITRFLAVIGANQNIKQLGPVRSARPYYLDWAMEYGALYVHAGGSESALVQIINEKIFDLDGLIQEKYFWRDDSRAAPHNLYTSNELLNKFLLKNKAAATGSFAAWPYKADGPLTPSPIKEIGINFSGASSNAYNVKWVFQSESDSYLRQQNNSNHKMADGSLITAKNVILLFISGQQLNDELGHIKLLPTLGGRLVAFLDGRVIEGKWSKGTRDGRTKFFDSTGQALPLNRGNTWIEAVPNWVQTYWN